MGDVRTNNLPCVPGDYGTGYAQPLNGSEYSITDDINITWHRGGGGGAYGTPTTNSTFIFDLYLMSYIRSGDEDGQSVVIADNISFLDSALRTVDTCGGIYLKYIYKIPTDLINQIPGIKLSTSKLYISATNRTSSSNVQTWFSPNFFITDVSSKSNSIVSNSIASVTPGSTRNPIPGSMLGATFSTISSASSISSSTSNSATSILFTATLFISPALPTSPTSSSAQQAAATVKNNTSLTPGVKAGIGTGAALLAIPFLVAVLYLLREKRRQKTTRKTNAESLEESTRYGKAGLDGIVVQRNDSRQQINEIPAPIELPAEM